MRKKKSVKIICRSPTICLGVYRFVMISIPCAEMQPRKLTTGGGAKWKSLVDAAKQRKTWGKQPYC